MSDEYLARPMSRAEHKLLTPDEKRDRNLARNRINYHKHKEQNDRTEYIKTYYQEKKEEINEKNKNYYQENKEEINDRHKEYSQTPAGKKSNKISSWKLQGLQETKEDLDWIYDLYLNQELCYSCDVKLTRDSVCCPTQSCLDHNHLTNRFRQICCRACNNNDHWMTYWC